MENETALLYSQKYLEHVTDPSHPESANRLTTIMKGLRESGVLETGECSLVEPDPIDIEDVELVHEPDYIELVEEVCLSGGGLIDQGDTMVCPKSFEVALLAAAGALRAVDLVITGKFHNAFAFVRPPGHHAGPYYAMGFCIFNNVAIAAAHLLHRFDLERVLILDIDAHHGNGTQEIFYDTDRVLYISLHQDPTQFPGMGFTDEVGEGDGLGYTVNIPFPFQIDDNIYLKAFNQVVIPIIQQYRPQFMLVSAGFDGHYTDPVADLSLSLHSYVKVFEYIQDLASRFSNGKFMAVLEGGYNLNFLRKVTTVVVARMTGVSYHVRDKRLSSTFKIREQSEKILEEVKHIQSSFWSF